MSTKQPVTLPAIAFIGGGNMATAMIGGLAALSPRPALTVSEPDAAKHAPFTAKGCATTTDNLTAVATASVVVLAIKPQMAAQVVPGLASAWQGDKLLISILAGTPTAKLQGWLGAGARVVRAMPNTPLAIGKGMVGLCAGANATARDLDVAEAVFAPCGKVLRVTDEGRMDAITAVSGSGPAYFFRFAEALVDAAMAIGFTREEAVLLVGQTGAGSWEYLLAQGFEAKRLREQVTSPGGTTAAALKQLDAADFTGLVTRALVAAEQRGKELAALG
ncbi:MAG TPA: pyrroline-5-carboxylate reductase [Planctomycetota bacterium]|jgi:pyrroline-5-carboxylate reductase|nr:pyrroline-5-carboxylate reductase [Planctomycetota bacterium]